MKPKPVAITKTAINFTEASKYIEGLLGYKLRDTLGSFEKFPKEKEYRDYWHFLTDRCMVLNGGTVHIGSWLNEDCEEWQKEITNKFVEEFGDEQVYWTEW